VTVGLQRHTSYRRWPTAHLTTAIKFVKDSTEGSTSVFKSGGKRVESSRRPLFTKSALR